MPHCSGYDNTKLLRRIQYHTTQVTRITHCSDHYNTTILRSLQYHTDQAVALPHYSDHYITKLLGSLHKAIIPQCALRNAKKPWYLSAHLHNTMRPQYVSSQYHKAMIPQPQKAQSTLYTVQYHKAMIPQCAIEVRPVSATRSQHPGARLPRDEQSISFFPNANLRCVLDIISFPIVNFYHQQCWTRPCCFC